MHAILRRHARSAVVSAAAIAVLAHASLAGSVNLDPSIKVLVAGPLELPAGLLLLPPSPMEVTSAAGAPRIDNDGNWYAVFAFPVTNGNDPFEYTRNIALLRGGDIFNREGYQFPGSPDFLPVADFTISQTPYEDISIANDGTIAQVVRGITDFPTIADGSPDAAAFDFETIEFPRLDLVVVDNQVVLREGEIVSPLSEFFGSPGDPIPLFEISSARAVSAQDFIALANFSENENTFDPEFDAVFTVTGVGTPSESIDLLFTDEPGNPIPGLGFELSTYSRGEAGIDHNVHGDFLFTGDVRGAAFDEDDALILYTGGDGKFSVLARAGEPSLIPGADWSVLINNPVALNDNGDWAARLDTTAASASDQIIVVNNRIIIREDDIVGTAAPGELQLDSAIANLEIDADGNVIWYGAWSVPNLCDGISSSGFGIFEGIFYNDQLLLEAGVTEINDVTIGGTAFPTLVLKDLPNTQEGFYVSPDGTRLIVSALFAEPSSEICTFSINVDAPTAPVLLEIDLTQFSAEPCPGDVNGDGIVDTTDLGILLGAFGSAVRPGTGADLNGDGVVDTVDLGALLGAFGGVCG